MTSMSCSTCWVLLLPLCKVIRQWMEYWLMCNCYVATSQSVIVRWCCILSTKNLTLHCDGSVNLREGAGWVVSGCQVLRLIAGPAARLLAVSRCDCTSVCKYGHASICAAHLGIVCGNVWFPALGLQRDGLKHSVGHEFQFYTRNVYEL